MKLRQDWLLVAIIAAMGITGIVSMYFEAKSLAEKRARIERMEAEARVLESRVRALEVELRFQREVIVAQTQDADAARAATASCERSKGEVLVSLGDAYDQIDFLRSRLRARNDDLTAVLARLRTREADYVCALEALDGIPDPECWRPEFRAREGP